MTTAEIIKGLKAVRTIHNGNYAPFIDEAIKELKVKEWIPCSERLPKEDEYDGDVCKYYLIQDEYGDMHVAHYKKIGWIPMRQIKALEDNVIAWMPLPPCYDQQESDHKCHTCKHYTSGERDGSCGSYICKHYSNWESEETE